mgnify:CR=1 FL=1|tara:strand:+ start:1100 stop:1429 length:330 start_codon:yes stop_codon:yes gene_type:complete
MELGKPYTHIEDILIQLYPGQWFTWSDTSNKIYENIRLIDKQYTIPTKEFLESELLKKQQEWDGQAYARARKNSFPEIGDQLDDLYHKGAFSDEMSAKIKKVKDDNPKP